MKTNSFLDRQSTIRHTMTMFVIALAFSGTAQAVSVPGRHLPPEAEPPIRKGAVIEIKSVDVTAGLVEVKLPAEPATGPNRAKLSELAKSLKGVDVKKNPQDLIGNQYSLDEALPLLTDLGVAKERKKRGLK